MSDDLGHFFKYSLSGKYRQRVRNEAIVADRLKIRSAVISDVLDRLTPDLSDSALDVAHEFVGSVLDITPAFRDTDGAIEHIRWYENLEVNYQQLVDGFCLILSNHLSDYHDNPTKNPFMKLSSGLVYEFFPHEFSGCFAYPTRQLFSGFEDNIRLPVKAPEYVPRSLRFQHTWIMAPNGHGKSTLLADFLVKDLDAVARNECSVVLIDPKVDLVSSVAHSARFGPGGDLEGRLIYIDPSDTSMPCALNIFDMGSSKALNTVAARGVLDYIFESLLGAGASLTDRQRTVFGNLISLLSVMDGANIDTLNDLLTTTSLQPYRDYISRLPGHRQEWFRDRFLNPQDRYIKGTKTELRDRIFSIKDKEALYSMFRAQFTKLDLYKELNESKVIVANLASAQLGPEVELFGRVLLAMLWSVGKRRQLDPESSRHPTYVYLDEAHNVIRHDTNMSDMLTELRSSKIGLVLAHHHLGQIRAPDLDKTLINETAIKIMASNEPGDARKLAASMRVEPNSLLDVPKYNFVVSAGGATGNYHPPYVSFRELPTMSDREFDDFLQENRYRYSFIPKEPELMVAEETEDYDPTEDDGQDFH